MTIGQRWTVRTNVNSRTLRIALAHPETAIPARDWKNARHCLCKADRNPTYLDLDDN